MTTEPRESTFDEKGEPISLGDKFDAPGDELLILKKGSGEWVNAKDVAKQGTDLDEDFTPVPNSDTTFFPYGRPNP